MARPTLAGALDLRSAASTALRVAVSAVLLWYVVSRIGLGRLLEGVSAIPPAVFALAIGLSVVNVALSAAKWKVLLDAVGERHPFRRLFAYYYIGQFFNAFLPTNVGGDSVRMYYVYDEGEDGSAAVSSVLVERATGLVAVLLVGGVATVVAFDRLPTALRTLVLLGCAGGLGVTGVLWTGAPRGLLARSVFRIERFDAGARCERLYDSIAAYRDAGRALGWALLLSLLFRFVLVANTYAMAVGIGMDVHPVYFLVFVPIVEIALFLPVSIQGFGVRETAYAVLFGSLGTPPELAVTLGFAMQLVLGVVNNLLGGLVYVGYAVVGGERPDA